MGAGRVAQRRHRTDDNPAALPKINSTCGQRPSIHRKAKKQSDCPNLDHPGTGEEYLPLHTWPARSPNDGALPLLSPQPWCTRHERQQNPSAITHSATASPAGRGKRSRARRGPRRHHPPSKQPARGLDRPLAWGIRFVKSETPKYRHASRNRNPTPSVVGRTPEISVLSRRARTRAGGMHASARLAFRLVVIVIRALERVPFFYFLDDDRVDEQDQGTHLRQTR